MPSSRAQRTSVHRARILVVAVLVVSTVLAAACSGDDGADSSTGDELTAAGLLERAAVAMGEVDSVKFSLAHDGAPVFIGPGDLFGFDRALGQFSAPDSAQAVITVLVSRLRAEIGAKAIGDEAWIQLPNDSWQELPASWGFEPAQLFDPKGGWQPLIAELTDPEIVGEDDDGVHIRATSSAERISVVTAGLVDDGVDLDLWIDPDTAEVGRMEFDVEVTGGTAGWVITLDEYGEPVDVTRPV
jgi:hypothetical protein